MSESNSTPVDVKRIVGFVLLGSALGIVFFVFYFLLTGTDEDVEYGPFMGFGPSYTGQVLALDDSKLVMEDREGVKRTFQTDNNTRVTMRGSDRLRVGAEVMIRYKQIRNGGVTTFQARTIRVLAHKPSPAPSTSASASASVGASPSPGASPATSPTPTR